MNTSPSPQSIYALRIRTIDSAYAFFDQRNDKRISRWWSDKPKCIEEFNILFSNAPFTDETQGPEQVGGEADS